MKLISSTVFLLVVLSNLNRHRAPDYTSNYGSFTVKLEGYLPRFDCKGFEQETKSFYRECMARTKKDENGKAYYGDEENCIKYAKEAWCSNI